MHMSAVHAYDHFLYHVILHSGVPYLYIVHIIYIAFSIVLDYIHYAYILIYIQCNHIC